MAEQILSEIGTDVKKQFPTAAICVPGQAWFNRMKVQEKGNRLKLKKETSI
jgi:hypothetical protein